MSKIPVILGPTASGKTSLAIQLARKVRGEIISADSRQIYQSLNIGTGKDLKEYGVGEERIPYHLIDILPIGDKFSVAHFQFKAIQSIQTILEKQKLPIICGGTGLYIQALLNNYQFSHLPVFLEKPLEYSYEFKVFGLNPPLANRRENCRNRLIDRIENQGLIQEAEGLLKSGVRHEQLEWLGLEYKWLSLYLKGEIDKKRLVEGLTTAIQQYAKRQMTFFRKMEKEDIYIDWIPDAYSQNEKLEYILEKF